VTAKRILYFSILGLAVSACGTATNDQVDFDSQLREFITISDQLERQDWDITDAEALPHAQSANFYGRIYIAALDGDEVLQTSYMGDLSLTANFLNDTVSGDATNFFEMGNQPVSGSLAVSNGSIDRTAVAEVDHQFTANLSGTLTDSINIDLEFDAAISGDFYGPAAEGATGDVHGDINSPYGSEIAEGSFILLQ